MPLDANNRNCWIESGDLLGVIGDPNQLEAVSRLPEADVKLIQPDQAVRLRRQPAPGESGPLERSPESAWSTRQTHIEKTHPSAVQT